MTFTTLDPRRTTVYTGKTERPCCLCGREETVTRVDLPPRAVTLMRHGDPIAWRDIVGEVAVHFCADDWDLVCDLVLSVGVDPLPRCNVAHASFDLREDFEALLNETREEPDQRPVEASMRETSERRLADPAAHTDRELVEARLIQWTFEDAGSSLAEGETG